MSKPLTENGPTSPSLPSPAVAPAVGHSGHGRAWSGVALLCGIAALGLSGWLWWQYHWPAEPPIEQQLAPLQAELTSLRTAMEQRGQTSAADLAQLRAADARIGQAITDRIEAEQALAAQLNELNRADRRLWQLAEAEYLLQLAQQRLRTGGEASSALQLLRQADSILGVRADPDLYPVRAALAREIAALEAVPKVDIDGLYLRLQALAERAAALPLIPEPEWQPPAAPVESEAQWQQRLRNGFAAAWQKFSSYIRIRQRDQPLEPLLEPPVERALRLNLELLTEQAQLALMAHNPALFNHSLERAAAWLERYYRVDPAASAELATAFRTLAATTIRAELPELGAARRALATYLDGRRPGGAAGAADTGGASQ